MPKGKSVISMQALLIQESYAKVNPLALGTFQLPPTNLKKEKSVK